MEQPREELTNGWKTNIFFAKPTPPSMAKCSSFPLPLKAKMEDGPSTLSTDSLSPELTRSLPRGTM